MADVTVEWNTIQNTEFLTEVLREVLYAKGEQVAGIARNTGPVLKTRVGRSSISPRPGGLRSATEAWIGVDHRGMYCAVGDRGPTAPVVRFLGGAGHRQARQVRRPYPYLIDAMWASEGIPF
jgi:hypothetical protein